MPSRRRRRARASAARRARPSHRRRARGGPSLTLSRCRDCRARRVSSRSEFAPSSLAAGEGPHMRIDLFAMERMQSLHWHRVKYDLSESGVLPLSVQELLRVAGDDRERRLPRDEARLSAVGRIGGAARADRALVSGRDGGERDRRERRFGSESPRAVEPARAGRSPRVHGAELSPGLGPRPPLRGRDRRLLAAARVQGRRVRAGRSTSISSRRSRAASRA